MNQDFVSKGYRVSNSVYPVGMAPCTEGTLAPGPDLPSVLTVGLGGSTVPSLSHLSLGLCLLSSLLAPPVAEPSPPPGSSAGAP